jgi:4-amino-4-deoxy-L-arabinose transferase-like glycosyltransferase
MQFPIWGDEGLVLIDVLDCDYYALTQTLPIFQIAPILFLWAERAVLQLVGSSELAVRLPAFLAGLGGLLMVAWTARRFLSPVHGALTIALLAVSYWPVRHSCEVKPYALDLLASAGLFLGALTWLHQPARKGWLLFLALWTPVALLASYPAAFVAGGMSLAMLPRAWRASSGTRGRYALFNLLMVLAFAGHYVFVTRNQIDTPQLSANRAFMQDYWHDSFPPASLRELPLWLLGAHTGGLFAYPFGGTHFDSTGMFALALLGCWHLWKRGQRSLLLVCVCPFALNFLAAVLHKYPYGSSPRVLQHLAPMACVLIAAGAACVVERLRAAATPSVCVVGLALIGFGVAGLVRDVCKPYKSEHEMVVRQRIAEFEARVGPDEPVLLCNQLGEVPIVATWYLRRDQTDVAWASAPPIPLPEAPGVWLLRFTLDIQSIPSEADVLALLGERGRVWSPSEFRQVPLPPSSPGDPGYWLTMVRVARPR